MKKKLIAMLTFICIIISALPVPVLAESVDPDETVTHSALMRLDQQQPSGYDSESTLHPYGINNKNFKMLTQNELYLFESYDMDGNSSNTWLNRYDNFLDLVTSNNSDHSQLKMETEFSTQKLRNIYTYSYTE